MVKNNYFSKGILALAIVAIAVLCFGVVALLDAGYAKAETNSADVTLSINSAIAVSVSNCDSSDPSQLNLTLIPSPTGTFTSNCQTVNVNTNAPGYTLMAKASSSTLDYLNPTNISPTPTIASTANSVTSPAVLAINTWGFAVEGGAGFDLSYTAANKDNKYAALPTVDEQIYETDQFPLPKKDHKFYYGANVSTSKVAGTYSATVTYTAIGAEVPKVYLDRVVENMNITTMQQLTANLCSIAEYNPANGGINDDNTVVLTDTRNNQDYRVRKMPDNKCWMIDNLKLATPGTDLTLTSDDTNLAIGATFTIPATQATSFSTTAPTWNDPGTTTECSTNTPINSDTKVYSDGSKTKCGYLYNWYAATAGTGTDEMATSDATSSICPVGWRLPSAGTGAATTTNEFAVLNGAMMGSSNPSTNSDATVAANWHHDGPFSGSYAGYWFAGGFLHKGSFGYYWSSSANNTTSARYLSIDYSSVIPGGSAFNLHVGSSIRCTL